MSITYAPDSGGGRMVVASCTKQPGCNARNDGMHQSYSATHGTWSPDVEGMLKLQGWHCNASGEWFCCKLHAEQWAYANVRRPRVVAVTAMPGVHYPSRDKAAAPAAAKGSR